MNEIEPKRTIARLSEMKNWFFEKIIKFDKYLAKRSQTKTHEMKLKLDTIRKYNR